MAKTGFDKATNTPYSEMSQKDIESQIGAMTSRQASETLKNFSEIFEVISKVGQGSKDFSMILELIGGQSKLTADQLALVSRYFAEGVKNGKDLSETASKLKQEIKSAAEETAKLSDYLKTASNVFREIGDDKFSTALSKGAEAIRLTSAGLAEMATVVNAGAGMLKVAEGAIAFAEATKKIREWVGDTNRSIYDMQAALGQAGVFNDDLVMSVAKLRSEYANISEKEIMKTVKGLVDVGTAAANVESISRDVANRFTMWSDLTPEKQTKMMSDYMKTFGVSAGEASNQVGLLYENAQKLKNSMKDSNIDVKAFAESSHQISINSRQWGYNLGDASALMSSLAVTFKDVTGNINQKSLEQFATGVLQSGTKMEEVIYQMQKRPENQGKSMLDLYGSYLLGGNKQKLETSLDMSMEYTGVARGGEVSRESMASAMMIAKQQAGAFQGIDPKTISDVVKAIPDKIIGSTGEISESWKKAFTKGIDEAQKKKDSETSSDAKAIIHAVTTEEGRLLAQMESTALSAKGILDFLLFPDKYKKSTEETETMLKHYPTAALARKAVESGEYSTKNKEERDLLLANLDRKVSEERIKESLHPDSVKTANKKVDDALKKQIASIKLTPGESVNLKGLDISGTSETQTVNGRTFRVVNKTSVEDVTPVPNPKTEKRNNKKIQGH